MVSFSEISASSIGLLVAFGSGVYLHIAATECMPRIHSAKLSLHIRVACFILFIVGAVLIVLVLLDHQHGVPLVPEGASGPTVDVQPLILILYRIYTYIYIDIYI